MTDPGERANTSLPVPDGVDRAVMNALLTESPVGLYIVDTDLRLIRFNTASAGVRGVRGEEVIGRPLRELAPLLVNDANERILREVAETGEPVIDLVQRGSPPSDPEREHVYSVSALQLVGSDDQQVIGVATIVIDVTERYRARDRLELLARSSALIGTSLDVTRTAEELTEVAVPQLADAVAIDILDPVFQGYALAPGPVGDDATLRRTAFRSEPEGRLQPAFPVGTVNVISPPTPFSQCLSDLRPRLVRDVEAAEDWLMREPLRAERIRAAQVDSLVVAPLAARGVILGVASFYRWRRPEFDEDDVTTAVELAARTAVCVDNARRYTRESRAARALQHSLLPTRLPDQNAVEVSYCHVPAAEAAGWYDVIPLPGARVALVVGTVGRDGLRAAAAAGRLRAAVHTLAALDLPPDELLAHLDDLMVRLGGAPEELSDEGTPVRGPSGATCVYAVYDATSGECVFARAAHPAPEIVHPDGTVAAFRVPDGPRLGLNRAPFESCRLHLPAGSLLAFYTPELLRCLHGRPRRGLQRLRRQLAHPERSVQDTCDATIYSLVRERPRKDVVLLTARTRLLNGDRIASWTFPDDPAIVATARRLASSQLVTWGLEELDTTTLLLVSELVTNAIRYAGGKVQLRLIHDTTLTCEVSDRSSAAPHVRHPRASDEGGRGLLLVAQLADRWGTRQTVDGKIIWAEQALPVPGTAPIPPP
ncbi:SpoIIE family protein phosphatase [Kitasatospora sp. NPDC048538]|uniref:SpoIIE family protein phosphatase n=1 Tax=unclassified Kitasatospora TaxID=2633591 RepID=UPI0033C93EDC